MLSTLNRFCKDNDYICKIYPKIEKLLSILVEHFDRHHQIGSTSTKVIIFANLRSTVSEIVSQIDKFGHIRAHQFVGQATNESGMGLNQKQQVEVLDSFKSGSLNVLVATCIAEEGLDIGSCIYIYIYLNILLTLQINII